MIHFFSIELYHEYDLGISEHLSIIPTANSAVLIRDNRVLFRIQSGRLECYIEDNELIKDEIEHLNFWIIYNDDAFYNYTDLDATVNFYKPHFYWSNTKSSQLISSTIEEQINNLNLSNEELQQAPKNAIGLLQVSVSDITSENNKLTIQFKVKKTIWQYNILPKEEQTEWEYKIEDEKNEWVFREIKEIEDNITFQSIKPISYKKRASNRLKLSWKSKNSAFEEEQNMILPFANYAYKMVSQDGKELTPVYIYI